MKIMSCNVNGIRAARRKGFFEWMLEESADVVCLQETRIQMDQLDDFMLNPPGYQGFFFPAEKKGYSGVAIYTKQQPDQVQHGIGWSDFDAEGRWIQADYGKLSVVSIYLPSGSRSEERQQVKYQVLDQFLEWLKEQRQGEREWILCGDWNIAHKEIDLKNWKSNQKSPGFLPEEREWMTNLFDNVGYVDVFRKLNPNPDQYTWWSNRGRAREKNVGWRIDYQVTTPKVAQSAKNESIYTEQNFSDHAPLTIHYDVSH